MGFDYQEEYAPEVPARVWCTGTANPSRVAGRIIDGIPYSSSVGGEFTETETDSCADQGLPYVHRWGYFPSRVSTIDGERPQLFPDVLNIAMNVRKEKDRDNLGVPH